MADKKSCLIIGAGDDTGSAIARAFAREGMVSCVVRFLLTVPPELFLRFRLPNMFPVKQ